MKISLFRHGEGIHNINEPTSFSIKNPSLTEKGIKEIQKVANGLDKSIITFTSPTTRTIQSSLLLSNKVYYVNLFGPRIYPHKRVQVMQCDELMKSKEIEIHFTNIEHFKYQNFDDINIHPNELLNNEYQKHLANFFEVVSGFATEINIVTHDGVIATIADMFSNTKFIRDKNNNLMKNGNRFELFY